MPDAQVKNRKQNTPDVLTPEQKPNLVNQVDSTTARELPTALENSQVSENLPNPKEINRELGESTDQISTNEEEGFLDEALDSIKDKFKKGKKGKPTSVPQVRDELTVQVEQIMEEGLKDAFVELTPIQRQEFKIKGEKTAIEIRNLMRGTHVKIKKIFRLLFDWLKLLPGINKFFLEQEAKIKADKIMSLTHIKLDQK